MEERTRAWEIEWQGFRYHDRQRWSRLCMIALLEAAYFAGIYATDLDAARSLVLAVFASAVVLLVSLAALADQRSARTHLERALLIEKQLGLPLPPEHSRPTLGLRGAALAAAFVVINVLNVIVIADQVFYLVEDTLGATETYL